MLGPLCDVYCAVLPFFSSSELHIIKCLLLNVLFKAAQALRYSSFSAVL